MQPLIEYPAVTYAASQHQGRLFWIVCKWPAFLSSFSRLQLIQNSAPSVAGMRQCDIRMKHSNRIHRKREWCKSAVIWLEKTREIASIYFWRGWVIDLQVWIELNLGWLQPNQAKYIFNWNSSKQFLLLTFNLPLHRSVRSFRQRIYFCARIDLKGGQNPPFDWSFGIFLTKDCEIGVSKQVTSLIFCKTFGRSFLKIDKMFISIYIHDTICYFTKDRLLFFYHDNLIKYALWPAK